MTKVIEHKDIAETLAYIVEHMATKEDLGELEKTLRAELASKADFFALQTQINAIEAQLRNMKYDRLVGRVADLEDEVFGESRP